MPENVAGWIQEFVARHGRAPRVLHIGNIANNAYNNAKLLNAAGLDCDVISYDYYHAMGCPEWEDADFAGNLVSEFFPAWESVNLNGFQRPPWFAQGQQRTCLCYLIAKRKNEARRARWLWGRLQWERYWIGLKARNPLLRHLITLLLLPLLLVMLTVWYSFRAVRKVFRICNNLVHGRRWDTKVAWYDKIKKPEEFPDNPTTRRLKQLIQHFEQEFPERSDRLTLYDMRSYPVVVSLWASLFEHYDLIIGYATDPILPLMAGKKYYGLEHGTLRDIPFQQTASGRLTALAYHCAEHVFVTNSDCIDKARQLVGERFTFLNHPFDDRHGLNVTGWEEQREALAGELDARFLFFFPTRQDWVAGTGYADKANDIFLRAFARLRREGVPAGMVCCRWGKNVAQSIKLLEELGVSQHVKWVEPLGIVRFERMARACHMVVDQFKLGAFGGVLFKSLAARVPCCTYLDEAEMVKRFGACPPVINSRSEEELVRQLRACWDTPGVLEELGRRSREWIENYYSSRDTVAKQLAIYEQALAPRHECRAA